MIYLAYIIFTFTLIQLIVALINCVCVQRPRVAPCTSCELVSVLIPARNEENNIAGLLSDLLRQEYPNIEIIVFNDLSTDRTEEIVRQMAQTDTRIRLVNSEGLPVGWLGKNYACHCLSLMAKGEYFLFLDADVRLKDGIIGRSVALADQYKTGLLSIFPKQKMGSVGEYLTVPIMNYILLTLLPLVLVRKSAFSSMAAANGQFMLFKRERYLEIMPHELFKNNRVEDIEIARYLKRKKIPVVCSVGDDTITCRMYHGFQEAVNGFSKNVIGFFGNSVFAALLFWIVTTFGFLVVWSELSTVLCCLFLFLIVATRVAVSAVSKQSILLNVLLLAVQQLMLGWLIYKAVVHRYNRQLKWKGRSV
ncbi:MAG: glycosyltransferase family 2 protein [Bacteroidales bacterium]|nr:glycosyltransferase family 2 protein [Bacteroidales bacterium]